jgi:hypothetical protein
MFKLSKGSRFLLRVDPSRDFDVFQRSGGLQLDGDISLVAADQHPEPEKGFSISLEHIGLIGPGTVVPGKGPTGAVSVLGIAGTDEGIISDEADGVAFVSIPLRALVLYDAIDEQRGFTKKDDRLLSFVETFSGRLQGSIRSTGDAIEQLAFEQGSLILGYEDGGLGWIRDIAIPLDGNRVSRLRPAQDVSEPKFTLRIRPVGFKASCDDPKPSGSSAKAQLDEAFKIWKDCGVELDIQEIQYVVNKDLKKGTSVEDMRNVFDDPIRRTIEIFFSASDQFPDGGGQSVSCGMAQAAIAVTDNSKELPHLVAHEIGHILNGIHPTDTVAVYGEWNGDDGSVLEPFGGGIKNPVVLGQEKRGMARNAALEIIKS